MSFENLLASLEEKGKAEESAIINAAKAEARKINASASEKAKQIMDEAKREGEKLGLEQRSEINANARLRQRKVVAEAREALLNAAIEDIEPLLKEFAQGKAYDKLLLKLAGECTKALGKDCSLHCKASDEKTLKTAGFKASSNVKIIGGVIAESPDGRIRVNNSLEALLENHGEKLKQAAFKELASIFKQLEPVAVLAVKTEKPGQTSKPATQAKQVPTQVQKQSYNAKTAAKTNDKKKNNKR